MGLRMLQPCLHTKPRDGAELIMTEETSPFGKVSALTLAYQFHSPVSVEFGARQH